MRVAVFLPLVTAQNSDTIALTNVFFIWNLNPLDKILGRKCHCSLWKHLFAAMIHVWFRLRSILALYQYFLAMGSFGWYRWMTPIYIDEQPSFLTGTWSVVDIALPHFSKNTALQRIWHKSWLEDKNKIINKRSRTNLQQETLINVK